MNDSASQPLDQPEHKRQYISAISGGNQHDEPFLPSTSICDDLLDGATFRPLNDPSCSIQHQGMPAEVAFENPRPKIDTSVMGRDAGVHRQTGA